jgi:hypothetical protein
VFFPSHYGLLDSVDLAIHETGHLVFGLFGEFIGILGGTLMQLLLPIAFAISFYRKGDRHAATVAIWWVAQNLWSIARYIGDAQAQELPLVGAGEHDWAYLLEETGLLEHDHVMALLVRIAGFLICAYSVMRGLIYARPRSATAPLD